MTNVLLEVLVFAIKILIVEIAICAVVKHFFVTKAAISTKAAELLLDAMKKQVAEKTKQ